jgi:hypothetical protein
VRAYWRSVHYWGSVLFRPAFTPALVTLILSATAGTAVANTYEVGAGKPYPTFAALPALLPGDVVLVHSGVYNEVVRWTASGLPEAPIVIRGVGASRPIVDGSGHNLHGVLPQPRALFQVEGSHYIIENLEFRNARNTSSNARAFASSGRATWSSAAVASRRPTWA